MEEKVYEYLKALVASMNSDTDDEKMAAERSGRS